MIYLKKSVLKLFRL